MRFSLNQLSLVCRCRKTFPKVNGNGKAVMVLEDMGLEITLSIVEDPSTQVPQVDEVDVRLHVEDFRIDVTEGAHIKLYNKMFGLVRLAVRKVRAKAHACCTNKVAKSYAESCTSTCAIYLSGCSQGHQYRDKEEAVTISRNDQ